MAEPAAAPGAETTAEGPLSDETWYRTVYRPSELQFTVRAVLFGCLIGSVLSAANLASGFKIGWTYGASITASISAWALFRAWSATGGGKHFTVLENNTMQTAASAAAAMAGAGMVNAVPALMKLEPERHLSFWQLLAWLTSVALLGVCYAIPLKRQMINVENLKFPSGIAAAETTLALHSEGDEGARKAKALFGSSAAAALVGLLRSGLDLIPESLPVVGWKLRGYALAQLTLQVDLSLLNMGAGVLVGLRTTVWMAIGATVCWAGLIPWVADNQFVPIPHDAPNYFGKAAKWCMWPGVTMLVVAGLASFALKAPAILAALRSLKDLKKTVAVDGEPAREDVEVPMRWFFWGFAAAALLCVGTQYMVFGMSPLQSIIAIGLSSILALVGTRAQGETDVNPIGAMGKVTQLLFSVIAPGSGAVNLMAAGVSAAGANNCGDMMQDLKTGRLLGASPRKQFWAQLAGISVGGLATVAAFLYAFPIDQIGTAKYPAPAVQTWKGMAELLTHKSADGRSGLANLPPHALQAMAIAAALALVFTLLAEKGPAGWRRWVPSATGLGLAFILPASNSYTFLVGAVIAELCARKWPKGSAMYAVAVASGLIAGESVMLVAVGFYTSVIAGH